MHLNPPTKFFPTLWDAVGHRIPIVFGFASFFIGTLPAGFRLLFPDSDIPQWAATMSVFLGVVVALAVVVITTIFYAMKHNKVLVEKTTPRVSTLKPQRLESTDRWAICVPIQNTCHEAIECEAKVFSLKQGTSEMLTERGPLVAADSLEAVTRSNKNSTSIFRLGPMEPRDIVMADVERYSNDPSFRICFLSGYQRATLYGLDHDAILELHIYPQFGEPVKKKYRLWLERFERGQEVRIDEYDEKTIDA